MAITNHYSNVSSIKDITILNGLLLRVMVQDVAAFGIPNQLAVDLHALSGNFFR